MKVIIAGSRSIVNYSLIKKLISESHLDITEIVSGGARGVDRLGEKYARENNIPIKQFLPDWENLGKVAAIIRNQEMAFYADALIAIWDSKSRGTKHMIEYMKDKMMKPTRVIKVK